MTNFEPNSKIASPSCCKKSNAASDSVEMPKTATMTLGIDERLGNFLPLDISFTDENGKSRLLKEFLSKPTIFAFVFYTCPSSCNILQSAIGEVVRQLTLVPGKDFNILSISIDEKDSPVTASKKKSDFVFPLGERFPSDAWHFLCGSFHSIRAVTLAAGFGFQRTDKGIVHPVALIFVTPEGKIVRYLHGTSFLPLSVTLALHEAAEGKVGAGIQSMVSFCFTYDSAGKKYALNIMRISGITILIFGVVFFFFLLRKKR
ncbi:MAG: SCO family protein [Candidatus Riflebacteria bacterium]|nr:SCO family protein [Candidatus Riflebacteria bacterium]